MIEKLLTFVLFHGISLLIDICKFFGSPKLALIIFFFDQG